MTLEEKYKAQMVRLGVWDEAFVPTVKDMCQLEREIRRCRNAWKATAEDGKHPSPLDDHYTLLRQLSRELQAYRETLGLTPKGLRRLRSGPIAAEPERTPASVTVLDAVRRRKAQ